MAEKTITLPMHKVFAKGSDGPFKCGTCVYFNGEDACRHPYIVKHHGKAVDDDDCCDFHTKKRGKKLGSYTS